VRRPYTFTQLVQLSDGSTYTVRTTSPQPLYRSQKDTRNHALWQPSDKSLRNVEVDEAGKLAAFRERFGRSWDLREGGVADAAADADAAATAAEDSKQDASASKAAASEDKAGAAQKETEQFDILGDLISGYATAAGATSGGGLSAKEQAKTEKKKKK
jgi:hypothetical protein